MLQHLIEIIAQTHSNCPYMTRFFLCMFGMNLNQFVHTKDGSMFLQNGEYLSTNEAETQ